MRRQPPGLAPVSYLQVQCGSDSIFPPSCRYYWKAQYPDDPGNEVFDTLLGKVAAAPAIKRGYDPTDLFCLNRNVRPAPVDG